MKQTAVEWLIEQINKHWDNEDVNSDELIKQAKEMEKEQNHAEYMRGWKDGLTKQETR